MFKQTLILFHLFSMKYEYLVLHIQSQNLPIYLHLFCERSLKCWINI